MGAVEAEGVEDAVRVGETEAVWVGRAVWEPVAVAVAERLERVGVGESAALRVVVADVEAEAVAEWEGLVVGLPLPLASVERVHVWETVEVCVTVVVWDALWAGVPEWVPEGLWEEVKERVRWRGPWS